MLQPEFVHAGRKYDANEWVQATSKKELQGGKSIVGTSRGTKVAFMRTDCYTDWSSLM